MSQYSLQKQIKKTHNQRIILTIILVLIIIAIGILLMKSNSAHFISGKEDTTAVLDGSKAPTIAVPGWKAYYDHTYIYYRIQTPPEWIKLSACPLGNDCFASPDIDVAPTTTEYDIRKGSLVIISHLGDEVRLPDYYLPICNKKGDITGNGLNTCLKTQINMISTVKLSQEYGNYHYVFTMYHLLNKNISISVLALPNGPDSSTIEKILYTFVPN